MHSFPFPMLEVVLISKAEHNDSITISLSNTVEPLNKRHFYTGGIVPYPAYWDILLKQYNNDVV